VHDGRRRDRDASRARAQYLPCTASAGPFAHLVAGLRRGLQESGFIECLDVAIEYRWAEGQYDRVPALAADLVRRQVAVIVTVGGETSARAAIAATATIPIVFNTGADPVKLGLVTSLARPGGNATGVKIFTTELVEKRLGLLRDLVPAAPIVAVLSNPNFAAAVANVRESEAAARAIGKEVVIFNASSDAEIETAFVNIVQERPGALLVLADPFFNSRRGLIVALTARHAIPAIYEWREFAEAGGLISYGTSLVDAYRQQGIYAARILKGEKAADLPIVQLSKFELIINLNTAKNILDPRGVRQKRSAQACDELIDKAAIHHRRAKRLFALYPAAPLFVAVHCLDDEPNAHSRGLWNVGLCPGVDKQKGTSAPARIADLPGRLRYENNHIPCWSLRFASFPNRNGWGGPVYRRN
jgi:putative ABC transport system substrate-binding protein